jgi:NAD(P)-dependent dehydrogenase (short-subunit alcohol dehydrogenase family)
MDAFQDKVVIVTGGASGIGRALCVELARRGAQVVAADLNAAGAAQVAAELVALRRLHGELPVVSGAALLAFRRTPSAHSSERG